MEVFAAFMASFCESAGRFEADIAVTGMGRAKSTAAGMRVGSTGLVVRAIVSAQNGLSDQQPQ